MSRRLTIQLSLLFALSAPVGRAALVDDATIPAFDGSRRAYLTTTKSDYASSHFQAEITVTVANGHGGNGCAFIGMGKGQADPNRFDEPSATPAISLRLAPSDFAGGEPSAAVNDKETKFPSSVTLRLRIYIFEAADLPAFLGKFMTVRKALTGPNHPRNLIPQSQTIEWMTARIDSRFHAGANQFYCPENAPWISYGWIGGMMNTFPMLALGDPLHLERVTQTLDFGIRGQGKSGYYYGCIDANGKTFGREAYDDHQELVLTRKNADVLFWMIKQFELLKAQGKATAIKPAWEQSVKRLAEAFVATWTTCYDYELPKTTELGRLGAKLAGIYWASTQNKHGAPGICTSSGDPLFKIYRATGNRLYADLIRDILHAHAESVRPGGYTNERLTYCDADSRGERGSGVTGWNELNGILMAMEIPGIYLRTDDPEIYVFDAVEVKRTGTTLQITNPTAFAATVSVFAESAAQAAKPQGITAFLNWLKITLKAGETKRFTVTQNGTIE